MSTCISHHGEYSAHILDGDYVCTCCGMLDEDAMTAELGRLRAEIERLKANQIPAGGKWEYGVSWRQRGDNPDRIDWLGADEDRCRQFVAGHHRASLVRRYVGPVEPIASGDDPA